VTYPAEHIATIDSSNAEAMRRIAAGMVGPQWIIAGEQTAGRGRSGRRWVSMPGNFYGSLILPLEVPRERASELSLLAGVAVVDALTATFGVVDGLRLKWPNDVLVGTAKLAGILIESTTTGDGRLVAVVGIGINLANPPDDIGRSVFGLTVSRQKVEPSLLVAPLSHSIERYLRLWSGAAGFAPIRDAWLTRAGALGEAMSVNTAAGPVAGHYAGLDTDGALLMQGASGAVSRITFGDVSVAGE
jgi:BirA family biotin operon repressor/biotin-[acetyl-CoA-carboxylase] ligase